MRRRNAVRSARRVVVFLPYTTVPESGRSTEAASASTVDFPAPLGPRNTVRPRGKSMVKR